MVRSPDAARRRCTNAAGLEPHDIDVDIDYTADQQWKREALEAVLYGRDPMVTFRRALLGSSRGVHLTDHLQAQASDIEMLTLWRRGDTWSRRSWVQIPPSRPGTVFMQVRCRPGLAGQNPGPVGPSGRIEPVELAQRSVTP